MLNLSEVKVGMKKDVDPAFMAGFHTIVVGEIKAYSDGRFFGHPNML
ncbi:hypothetical protein TEPIDINF_000553 [Tepidibacillus infernus]|nr:hypothetical protein [Tepidibacillus decaturensis]